MMGKKPAVRNGLAGLMAKRIDELDPKRVAETCLSLLCTGSQR